MKYFLLNFLLFFTYLAFGQNNTPNANQTNDYVAILTFSEKEHDFEEIKQGDIVEHTFKFKNTGKQPLVIASVNTTCGCTATKWSNQPILPDSSGSITVQFNTAGKQGIQNKVITIKSNATNQIERLIIKANILTKEN
ncbi:MAG: DUF1573 domain-containing protein [Cytophagales bacterium]|nr:MAG: DUF1573 domain-containing protein [Cytophagales bacterium]